MVDVSNLKATCNEVQESIQNLDVEINEALDMVHILSRSCDGGLECILESIGSKLHRITDITVMECINDLIELETGLQMFNEEQGNELGVLPGLTMDTVVTEDGDFLEIEPEPQKKRGRKKKNDRTLGDIFDDQELLEIGKEAFGK